MGNLVVCGFILGACYSESTLGEKPNSSGETKIRPFGNSLMKQGSLQSETVNLSFHSQFECLVFKFISRGICCHHPRKRFPGCPQSWTLVCHNREPKLQRLHRQREDHGSKSGRAETRSIHSDRLFSPSFCHTILVGFVILTKM